MNEPLENRVQWALDNYSLLNEQAEKQVIRSEWAYEEVYDLKPFHWQRITFAPGKIFRQQPVNRDGMIEYGFGSDDRLLLTRTYRGYTRYEELFLYEDNAIKSITYVVEGDVPVRVHSLIEMLLREGQPISFHEYIPWSDVHFIEKYLHNNGLLVEIHCEYRTPIHFRQSYEYLSYNESGELARIVITDEWNTTTTTYQRPAPDQTIDSLSNQVQERLIQLVPQIAAKLASYEKPASKIFCLALTYDFLQERLFPPDVHLGLEAGRDAWLRGETPFDWTFVWNPWENHFIHLSDYDVFDFSKDEQFFRTGVLLEQELFLTGLQHKFADLLNQVAVGLMKVDWSKLLNVTNDFVVYAVPDEQTHEHNETNALKIVAPLHYLAEWTAKGLYRA